MHTASIVHLLGCLEGVDKVPPRPHNLPAVAAASASASASGTSFALAQALAQASAGAASCGVQAQFNDLNGGLSTGFGFGRRRAI